MQLDIAPKKPHLPPLGNRSYRDKLAHRKDPQRRTDRSDDAKNLQIAVENVLLKWLAVLAKDANAPSAAEGV